MRFQPPCLLIVNLQKLPGTYQFHVLMDENILRFDEFAVAFIQFLKVFDDFCLDFYILVSLQPFHSFCLFVLDKVFVDPRVKYGFKNVLQGRAVFRRLLKQVRGVFGLILFVIIRVKVFISEFVPVFVLGAIVAVRLGVNFGRLQIVVVPEISAVFLSPISATFFLAILMHLVLRRVVFEEVTMVQALLADDILV